MVMDWTAWREMEHARRGPAWRRELALAAAAEDRRLPATLDAPTRRCADFFRMRSRGAQGQLRAERDYADLAAAEAIWADPSLRGPVQLLLLGNCSPTDIAERLNIDPEVLQAVESVHFDVRPMLSATAWIVAKVIRPEAADGHHELAAQMRFAFFGGPYAAMALVDSKLKLPTEPAERLHDAALLLHAKVIQALEMPLSPEQFVDFTKLYANIRHDEQRLQLDRDKLAFQMQRWAQRYELAKTRSESAGKHAAATPDEDSASTANTDGVVKLCVPKNEAA